MSPRLTAPLLALLLPAVLTACSTGDAPDPRPHAAVAGGDGTVRIVARDDADLVLHVSNQSFDDDVVRLAVAVDGVTVVDGDFHVEDQHNWVTFPLGLTPGQHEITAGTDSGASLTKSFEVPGDETRYAVVDYWTEGEGVSLSWLFRKRPVEFA